MASHYSVLLYTKPSILGILFDKISTSSYLQIAFLGGSNPLITIDFTKFYWLKGLKPKNEGYLWIVLNWKFHPKVYLIHMYDQIISMVQHPLPCWQEVFSEWNGAMFPAFMGTFTIPPPPLPASPSSTPATWSVLMIRTSRCKMSAPHIWANSSAFFKSCVCCR